MNYLKKRNQAFKYAFAGLAASLKTEAHMRIHAAAALIAIGLGLFLNISKNDWLWLIFCIVTVVISELFNTAIERLCDVIHPNYNANIKYIKDISAAAVLICSIGALIIGCFIFFPPLRTLIGF